jgi:hypothetical protein
MLRVTVQLGLDALVSPWTVALAMVAMILLGRGLNPAWAIGFGALVGVGMGQAR